MNRQQGTVKWFSRDKGWGFVRLEDGSEIFVHHTDIEGDGRKTLEDDERIEFSIERMDKGPRARSVRRLDAHAATSGQSRHGKSGNGRDTRRSGRGRSGRDRPRTATEQATDLAEGPAKPASLAEQLRNRLARLFPGIGT